MARRGRERAGLAGANRSGMQVGGSSSEMLSGQAGLGTTLGQGAMGFGLGGLKRSTSLNALSTLSADHD
jgi:hypothetical protein